MNKLTPQILNDGIRLDSVSTEPNKVFKYNYTLTDDVKENVTPEQIETFKKEAKEGALQAVKTSADLQEFRDNDVVLKYSYYDKNGNLPQTSMLLLQNIKPNNKKIRMLF